VVPNLGPDVPLHFTAFHPDWKHATAGHAAGYPDPGPTYRAPQRRAPRLTGNVVDPEGHSTYARVPGLLIGRDWYS